MFVLGLDLFYEVWVLVQVSIPDCRLGGSDPFIVGYALLGIAYRSRRFLSE